MKKQQLDHLLGAAGKVTGETQFLVIGSQSVHGKYPHLVDEMVASADADLVARTKIDRTEWLNAIGHDSPFHEEFGYYADPCDEGTATLPAGWKARLVTLPGTGGVRGFCLDPHDLVIAKYVAARDKDRVFNRELLRRALVDRERLFALLDGTPVTVEIRARIRAEITRDSAQGR
jgi:hypothetical protein